jgi:hypothetical protein
MEKQITGKSEKELSALGFEKITNLNPNPRNLSYAYRNGGIHLFPTFESSGKHDLYFEWSCGRTHIKTESQLEQLCKVLVNREPTESDKFVELHNKFKSLLDIKDFESVNDLMKSFNNDSSSVGDLKTILLITKSFKGHAIIALTRKNIVALLEHKLGQKLV